MAVQKTIQVCKAQGIMKEYLETRSKEVDHIMSSVLDEEYAMKLFLKTERENARKAGREAGIEAEKKKLICRLYDKGYPLKDIAEVADVSIDTVKEWLNIE